MERNIESLKDNFDILIIGGGVSGAAIAHEATLSGLKTAVIERKDFGHATSAATSKMIHGGLRYLARLQLGVVRESLRERRLLLQNLPQQAFPLPFLLPVYKKEGTSSWLLKIGLTLYDILSFDKNELRDPDKHLFNHQWLNKAQTLTLEPSLQKENLQGAFFYYDVQNKHPHRSNLSFVQSAVAKGAVAANYVSMQDFLFANNKVEGVIAQDELSLQQFEIRAKVTINASGPWGDLVLERLNQKPARELIRSKGIHVLVKNIVGSHALAMETKDHKHFFVLPWQGYTLLGTTDTPFESKNPDDLKVYRSEVEDLLKTVSNSYPTDISYDDVLHAYAGIRPLVKEGDATESYTASRKHEIVDHKKVESIDGLVSVFGGKWTTSRSLAEETMDIVLSRYRSLFGDVKRTSSTQQVLWGGDFEGRMSYYMKEQLKQQKDHSTELLLRLLEVYGSQYKEVLSFIEKDQNSSLLLDETNQIYAGEIAFAVHKEMAITLDDLLMRRIGLGNLGVPNASLLQKIADVMAKERNWDDTETQKQIQDYLEKHAVVDDVSS